MLRLELLYNYADAVTALASNGYTIDRTDKRLYVKNGQRYKVSWIHRNGWGQLTYIDLLPV